MVSIVPRTPGLEYKASTASPSEAGLIEADEETGLVEAIVSVTGVLDLDGDVIEPGSYAKTLARRRPKGIFSHDWQRWVARTEAIEELMPGDPRLPKTTKTGEPWPPEAGALWVKARFNLDTQEGRDAFSNIKFFSEEAEWSIGYRVPKGGSTRKDGKRYIKEIDLYEYSPVLFGANSLSGTLSVKEATPGQDDEDAETDSDPSAESPVADPNSLDDPPTPEEEDLHAQALADPSFEAETQPPGEEEEEEPAPDTAAEEEEEEEARPGEPGQGDGEDEAKRNVSASRRQQMAREGTALPDGSYPIATVEDLKNAIRAYGRAKPEDRAKVRRHILKRARALGRMDLIPDDWKDAEGAKGGAPGVADTPQDAQAVRRLKHWYVHGEGAAKIRWGTPGDFDRCVRLAGRHMPPEKAKGFCANVHKEATGEWPGRNAHGGKKDDPAAGQVVESTYFPHLPGSYEELRERIRQRAAKHIRADHIEVVGTWPERAVLTAYSAETGPASYEVTYALTAESKELLIGDAEPVELVVGVDDTGDAEALLPFGGMVDEVAAAVKAYITHAPESKAGRVLSGINAARIKAAVENLVSVLKTAGIEIGTPDEPERDEQTPTPDSNVDTTAPSARTENAGSKAVIPPDVLARGYRLLAELHAVN